MNDPLLAQLRDIHLPEPIGWWPPAPGWWLLALLVVAGMLALRWWVKHRRRRGYRRFAAVQARAIYNSWRTSADDQAYFDAVSRLLKQTALTSYPRAEVAPLSGIAWLSFLDSKLRSPRFTRPPLDRLAQRYRTEREPLSPQAVQPAVLHWIRNHRC